MVTVQSFVRLTHRKLRKARKETHMAKFNNNKKYLFQYLVFSVSMSLEARPEAKLLIKQKLDWDRQGSSLRSRGRYSQRLCHWGFSGGATWIGSTSD